MPAVLTAKTAVLLHLSVGVYLRGTAAEGSNFNLAIRAFACSVAHAFDAGFGEVPRDAAYARPV
jgi:hypothetical protein